MSDLQVNTVDRLCAAIEGGNANVTIIIVENPPDRPMQSIELREALLIAREAGMVLMRWIERKCGLKSKY